MVKIPPMPDECWEDMGFYGTACYTVDKDGKTKRVSPRDVTAESLNAEEEKP